MDIGRRRCGNENGRLPVQMESRPPAKQHAAFHQFLARMQKMLIGGVRHHVTDRVMTLKILAFPALRALERTSLAPSIVFPALESVINYRLTY